MGEIMIFVLLTNLNKASPVSLSSKMNRPSHQLFTCTTLIPYQNSYILITQPFYVVPTLSRLSRQGYIMSLADPTSW
jgi:hypothetical protein